MPKKSSVDLLKDLFAKKKVIDMKELGRLLNTTSRATAFRYLQQMHHLTSYTHNGRYYTLPEIAQFNTEGFWYFGDIGFSIHGTLMNTLTHVITVSEAGKTSSELEKHFRTRVQNSLQQLLKKNKIAKAKQSKPCLYVSPEHLVIAQQVKKRTSIGGRKKLPAWIVGEILVETIRSFPTQPQIDDVVKRLSKRGSIITLEQVQQVFDEEDLEKKTPD
jgi:predicted transcriptional regulator